MATMRKRHVFRPLWIGWLCVVLCLELLFPLTTARAEETPEPDTDAAASAGSPEALSYFQYYTAYAQAQRPQSAVVLKGTEPTAAAGSGKTDCVSTEADGELYGVLLEESSPWVEWSFDIAETASMPCTCRIARRRRTVGTSRFPCWWTGSVLSARRRR